MDVNDTELRQRELDNTMSKSESADASGDDKVADEVVDEVADEAADEVDNKAADKVDNKAADVKTSTVDSTEPKKTVMQTKEDYFDALRLWVKQYQLQQMAYMCFPYYLSTSVLNSTPISPPSFAASSSQR